MQYEDDNTGDKIVLNEKAYKVQTMEGAAKGTSWIGAGNKLSSKGVLVSASEVWCVR